MIDRIKREMDEWRVKADIWNTLNSVAKHSYCLCFNDFIPTLHDKTVYVMATEDEAVIILIDDYEEMGYSELADEESFNNEKPLYFTESSHRVSPVYELNVAAKVLNDCCKKAGKEISGIECILLTKSSFMNYEDMEPIWKLSHTIVLHELTDFEQGIIENTNDSLAGSNILNAYKMMKEKGELPVIIDDVYKSMAESAESRKAFHFNPRNEVNLCNTDGDIYDDFDTSSLIDENDPDLIEDDLSITTGGGNIKMKRKLPAVQVLKPLKNAKEVLNGLVGLDNIKKHLENITCLVKYNRKLVEYFPENNTHEINLHGIFYGNVGVGKTTVGRIYGSLLYECGVLSKGHVVLANRGSFVGTRWGDEEINVRLALKMAQGGVLMIDEAYLLMSDNRNDPGQLVLPQLLEILADESNRDIAVLLCGYEKPLLNLLSINQGLSSRFVNRYKFSDFTFNELLEISRRRVEKYNYVFTADAWKRYRTVLNECFTKRNVSTWSNARFIVNLLEQIYLLHAKRCMKSDMSGKDLLKIRTADIPLSAAVQEKESRIGFK